MIKVQKKIIKLYKNITTIEMEIQCFDENQYNEFSSLMKFISLISEGNNIFIDSYGLDLNSVKDAKLLLGIAEDLNDSLRKSLYLKRVNNYSLDGSIFNSRYMIFYVFKKNIKWNDFLMTRNVKTRKYIKNDTLIASISLGELESVLVCINKNFVNEANELMNSLENCGYKIK